MCMCILCYDSHNPVSLGLSSSYTLEPSRVSIFPTSVIGSFLFYFILCIELAKTLLILVEMAEALTPICCVCNQIIMGLCNIEIKNRKDNCKGNTKIYMIQP